MHILDACTRCTYSMHALDARTRCTYSMHVPQRMCLRGHCSGLFTDHLAKRMFTKLFSTVLTNVI